MSSSMLLIIPLKFNVCKKQLLIIVLDLLSFGGLRGAN